MLNVSDVLNDSEQTTVNQSEAILEKLQIFVSNVNITSDKHFKKKYTVYTP